MSPIPGSLVPCRTRNCHAMMLYPDDAIPAAKVLGAGARGWYCKPCAQRLAK